MSELILSLRSSSPSPSVILPLRSSIVTPSTTRSSICIAALLRLVSGDYRRWAAPVDGASPCPAARLWKDRAEYYAFKKSVKKTPLFLRVLLDVPGLGPAVAAQRLHHD